MYLIDTDIVIYALRGSPVVQQNMEAHAESPKSISVITYGELYFGAVKSQH